MWMPCGPKQQGAVQITMQELAGQGLAAKVWGIVIYDLAKPLWLKYPGVTCFVISLCPYLVVYQSSYRIS